MNARLETKIVDVSRSAHTGKETINRLLDRKSFEGLVEENGKYLLIDLLAAVQDQDRSPRETETQ